MIHEKCPSCGHVIESTHRDRQQIVYLPCGCWGGEYKGLSDLESPKTMANGPPRRASPLRRKRITTSPVRSQKVALTLSPKRPVVTLSRREAMPGGPITLEAARAHSSHSGRIVLEVNGEFIARLRAWLPRGMDES